MNKYRIFTPIPTKMTIEPRQEGYIKRLESAFKNANFERDGLPVLYDNNFERDVIGSRMVSTILKLKAADSVAYIELTVQQIFILYYSVMRKKYHPPPPSLYPGWKR